MSKMKLFVATRAVSWYLAELAECSKFSPTSARIKQRANRCWNKSIKQSPLVVGLVFRRRSAWAHLRQIKQSSKIAFWNGKNRRSFDFCRFNFQSYVLICFHWSSFSELPNFDLFFHISRSWKPHFICVELLSTSKSYSTVNLTSETVQEDDLILVEVKTVAFKR